MATSGELKGVGAISTPIHWDSVVEEGTVVWSVLVRPSLSDLLLSG